MRTLGVQHAERGRTSAAGGMSSTIARLLSEQVCARGQPRWDEWRTWALAGREAEVREIQVRVSIVTHVTDDSGLIRSALGEVGHARETKQGRHLAALT